MPNPEIVQKDAAVLREMAHPVEVKEITSKKIQSVLSRMKKALKSQDDGVAIAAPQISESLRIFIVSGRTLLLMRKDESTPKELENAPEDLVFINPTITKLSKKKLMMEEGCLSIRWLYGHVERSEKATITAYDENGKKFQKGASGLMAQIFQHEVDHLNGILFIDKAEGLHELPPEETHNKISE
ncbi:peptide deformylase [Candidatus Parcubacteria bacterium]|nr:peptide deformylase [Candidatus Parcubacteria bacterium]